MRPRVLQSLVSCRYCFYYRASKCQYHVFQGTTITNHGCFRSNTCLRPRKFLSKDFSSAAGSKSARGWSNKYFMITTPRPSNTKCQDILDQLSQLQSTSLLYDGDAQNPAVVILATPTFTTWLENKAFICNVLEICFPSKSRVLGELNSDVTALVAVVDGVPRRNPGHYEGITEGFAFLLCDSTITLPTLWQHDDINAVSDQSNHWTASIAFRMHSTSSIERDYEIGVPLANTLFRNGRKSTLFASRWNRTGDSGMFNRVLQVEKGSAIIHPASPNSVTPLCLEIPLEPLTPLRRVISGFGNILRQIENADGNIVSASQELEASIDSYLETKSLSKQTVTVWALILPHSTIVDGMREDNLGPDSKQIRASWTATPDSNRKSYVGTRLQQGRGAALYRILSGGGGWGLKQGLLSLDPETKLLRSTDISHSFDSSDSMDNYWIQELGDIAKPGSWVQFLISHEPKPNRSNDSIGLGTTDGKSVSASILSFGCMASTIDNMPQSYLEPSASNVDDNLQPNIGGYEGHFGLMSEAGIFICGTERSAVTSSKIDVPNSEFRLIIDIAGNC